MPSVKPDPPRKNRRDANLEATRAQVVQAAARLFLSHGYARTTLAAIAGEAGVAVQTLYNAVGNKAALLTAVLESTAAGPSSAGSAPARLRAATAATPDAAALLDLLADWFAEVHPRMAPLWRVIDEAAAHDPEVAAFARDRAHQRLRNYGEAAAAFAARGGLPAGLDEAGVAALIWSIGHPQVHRTLVEELGWTDRRYRGWVRAALGAALAPGGPARPD